MCTLILFAATVVTNRWQGEKVVHVELTERIHQHFTDKLEKVLSDIRNRLGWLRQGSRELFGTLLEERIVVVIDTSASMKDRLELVKEKIKQLIQVRERAMSYQRGTVLINL